MSSTIFQGSSNKDSVILLTCSEMKCNLMSDCFRCSCPCGAAAKKRVNISCPIVARVSSARVDMWSARALSKVGGWPNCFSSTCSTLSQSQFQATSCVESQSAGSSERSEASMHALYSARFTAPCARFPRRTARTSHSSCSLGDCAACVTMASKEASTSRIQTLLRKPITAALTSNISLKVVLLCAFFIIPPSACFAGEGESASPRSSAPPLLGVEGLAFPLAFVPCLLVFLSSSSMLPPCRPASCLELAFRQLWARISKCSTFVTLT
mmetsp:Transcript_60116/g.175659  ORF Transcript_60116/g.175659 Transcript_60116/m.175659 type:complete len:268 (+) Transcript_60116:416-1219(+)